MANGPTGKERVIAVPNSAAIRQVRSFLAAADWSGRVVIAAPDGQVRVADIPAMPGTRLTVPGALASFTAVTRRRA